MMQDEYDPIKASCCVPVVNRPYMIDGNPYYDGGMSDPIPYKIAFDDGCDRLVLILTRPEDFRRIPKNDKVIARLLEHHYPKAAEAMATRSEVYNKCLDECEKLAEEGKVCIVAPDSIGHMKTLTKDIAAIEALYHKGYETAEVIRDFMK